MPCRHGGFNCTEQSNRFSGEAGPHDLCSAVVPIDGAQIPHYAAVMRCLLERLRNRGKYCAEF
jgi:hypothetical protein